MALKTYKSDKRGKYKGTKIHFDEVDCQEYLDWYAKYSSDNLQDGNPEAVLFCRRIAKTIRNLIAEHPDLLEERTEEQIQEALLKDKKKIEEQLSTMKSGNDWKKVK